MTSRAWRLVLVAVVSMACVGLTAPSALANPTYSVMNAEGGIFWRSAPDWNTPVRINGFGVYNGEIIEPHCYQAGAGNVPGSADFMWEYASDVTGPGFGTGWLNEHFINDGQPINQPSPGVPPCSPPPPPAPGVSTGSATGATQSTATLNATVNPNGGNVGDCHFEYGATASYGATVGCTPAPGSGGSPVGVSASIGGLAANSTYHFRIVATNAGGTSYGSDVTFPTLPNAPDVATEAASSVTQTSAVLNASVNPNGGDVGSCVIEYGATSGYGSSAPCVPAPGAGEAPVAVSVSVAGLNPNAIYHFRVVAANAGGTSQGSDVTFTTLPEPPIVATQPASSLTQTAAELHASVNPNGASAECSFEYGPTASYGTTVPCASAPGSGSMPVAVSAEISALSPNTTYHYRITAANAGGTSYGSDLQFTTLGPPDFGRCIKLTPETVAGKLVYHGGFTSATCALASATHTGKFEWQPGVIKTGFGISLKEGVVTLLSVGHTKITCKGASGSGEIVGTKEVDAVRLTFTGCESLTHPCTSSGSSEGTITTAALEGALGWELKTAGTVGLDLYPPGRSGPVMIYRCVGATPTTVTGSVIAPVLTNRMLTAATLKFTAAKGIQKPTHLEGEEDDVLMASLNGEASEQLGLTFALIMTTEEAVEVNRGF